MNHIELFAGAGGLNLGLESEGFNLILANELSPMASETFSYNFYNTELKNNTNALWISSNYNKNEFEKRLKEDTRTYPNNFLNSDISDTIINKLLIGNIIHLNDLLESNPILLNEISNNLDLVSGGPPCQSFSMAGLREINNNRNNLPYEFAKFVSLTKPKFVLLENVSGILRPFDINGKKYYAYKEIAKTFANINYIPICIHINTKYIGIPQNRPRFLLIGIHYDLYKQMNFNEKEQLLIKPFLDLVEGKTKDCSYHDVEKHSDYFINTFLKYFLTENYYSVKEAIHDLIGYDKSDYVSYLNNKFNFNSSTIENHIYRNNNEIVKARFRIYQIINELPSNYKKQIKLFLKDTISLTNDCLEFLLKFKYYINSSLNYIDNIKDLNNYLTIYKTNKLSQKALLPNEVAPTVLSIADDVCHYDENNLRVLTVREMARIQSFPDSFIFKSKVTTGGTKRQYEVPQYTQVGNAIPPLLGSAIGKMFKELSEKY